MNEIYIDVTATKFYNQPFPISWEETALTLDQVSEKTGLTLDEIEDGIETGKLIRGLYILTPSARWIAELAKEERNYRLEAVNKVRYSEGASRADVVKEICKQLGMSRECFDMTFSNIRKKIGKNKELLQLLLAYYANQRKKGIEINNDECVIEYREEIIEE